MWALFFFLVLAAIGRRAKALFDAGRATEYDGESNTEAFGSAVDDAGDIDGDGVVDLVVGDEDFRAGNNYSGGRFSILFLNADRTVKATAHVEQANPAAYRYFGAAVAGMGDVDGDGVPDVAVSYPGFENSQGYDVGAVQFFYLNSDGSVKAESTPIEGTDTYNDWGQALANAGDLNGDGISDILVGEPGYSFWDNNNYVRDMGRLNIIFMASDETAASQVQITRNAGMGTDIGEDSEFGSCVAAIGDVNKDGNEDLLVGAKGDNAVFVLFMNANAASVASYQKISASDGDPNNVITGTLNAFGGSCSAMGDVDGDGTPDILVADLPDPGWGGSVGKVWALSLEEDGTVKAGAKVTSSSGGFGLTLGTYSEFGESVASIADVDGDGVRDFVVGDPYSDGALYIVSTRVNETCGIPGTTGASGSGHGCALCTAGKAAAAWQACTDCAVGRTSDAGAVSCVDCVAGKFQNTTGQGSCMACAAGKTSTAASTACTDCDTGKRGVVANSIGSCEDCGVGRYGDVVGLASCKPCAAGRFGGSQGLVECAECVAGRYEDAQASSACKGCPEGRFAENAGVRVAGTDCDACVVATYQDVAGQLSCKDCPAGRFASGSTAGGTVEAGCTACPTGRTQPDTRQIECSLCAAGRYMNETLSARQDCFGCPAGKYNEDEGGADFTACQSCGNPLAFCLANATGPTSVDPGFYASGPTGLERTGQQPCEPGYYCLSATKLECNAGFYQPNSAAEQCLPCVAGRYQSATAQTSCDECPAGSFCPTGAVEATACELNTYRSSPGGSSCTPCTACAAGKIMTQNCTTTNDAVCADCQAGRYSRGGNATSCSLCPEGHTCPAGVGTPIPCGSAAVYCPPGSASSSVVQAGYFSTPTTAAQNKRTGFSQCEAGTFCVAGVRESCPGGSYAPEAGMSSCTTCSECAPGRIVVSNCTATEDQDCEACPPGTYTNSSEPNARRCLPCPEGYFCLRGTAEPAPCGSAALFCPRGSQNATAVASGYYSVPEDVSEGLRTGQAECPAGHACVGGIKTACTAGEVQPLAGQRACRPCARCSPGSFRVTQCTVENADQAECEPCAAGRHANGTDGLYCDTCPAGTFCGVGAIDPLPCPPGFFGEAPELRNCTQCPLNSYQSETKQRACLSCPAHATTASEGSFTADSCQCVFGEKLVTGEDAEDFSCACPPGEYLHQRILDLLPEVSPGDTPQAASYRDVCEKCDVGMVCDAGTVLENATLESGYYRTAADSSIVYACPLPDACTGGNGVADELCAEGHEGPFCSVCKVGYYLDGSSGLCLDCASGNAFAAAFGLAFAVVVVVGGVVMFLCQRRRRVKALLDGDVTPSSLGPKPGLMSKAKSKRRSVHFGPATPIEKKGKAAGGAGGSSSTSPRTKDRRGSPRADSPGADSNPPATLDHAATAAGGETIDEGLEVLEARDEAMDAFETVSEMSSWSSELKALRDLKTKAKLVTSFMQMEAVVKVSFDVPLPQIFVDFLAFFNFFSFVFFSGVAGACISRMNYFYRMAANTTVPLAIMILLFLGRQSAKQALLKERLSYLMLLTTFMSLPSATTLSLFTFLCDKLDTDEPYGRIDENDKRFLVQDYSLQCDTPEHKAFQAFAAIMIVVYPIGIPLMYTFLLLRRPKRKDERGRTLGYGLSVPQLLWRCEAVRTWRQRRRDDLLDSEVGPADAVEDLLQEGSLSNADFALVIQAGENLLRRRSMHVAEAAEAAAEAESIVPLRRGRRRNSTKSIERIERIETIAKKGTERAKSAFGVLRRAFDAFMHTAKTQLGLRKDHAALDAYIADEKASVERIRSLLFLIESYEPTYWWFELFECGRRLALTVVPLFFERGTAGQQAVGVLMAAGFMLAYFVYRPYSSDSDDTLAAAASGLIFLVLLYGLIETASSGTFSETGEDSVGTVLIFMNCMILFVALTAVYSPALNFLAYACEKMKQGYEGTREGIADELEARAIIKEVRKKRINSIVLGDAMNGEELDPLGKIAATAPPPPSYAPPPPSYAPPPYHG